MNLSTLLDATWSGIFKGTNYDWVSKVFNPISIIMWIAMGVIGAAGAIYAIYLGVQLARADSDDKRKEAKTHLIYVLVAVAVTVILVLFFNTLLPLILKSILNPEEVGLKNDDGLIRLLSMRF